MAATGLLLQHALALLVARPHTSRELATKLAIVCARRRTSKMAHVREVYADANCGACVAAVLHDLRTRGLVDDAKYAEWHVAQRVRGRPRSRLQIGAELAKKGVRSHDVEAAVASTGYDEVAAASAALRRRRSPSSLQWAGYPQRVIQAAAARVAAEDRGDDDAAPDE